MKLVISPKRTAKDLALGSLFLTLAWVAVKLVAHYSGHDNLLGLVRQFDLSGEANLPTWYSSFLLLLCSVLLAAIASAKKVHNDSYALQWKALAIIFLFLAIDETAQIHEMLNEPLRAVLPSIRSGSFFYYAWVIPVAALLVIFALAYIRFLVGLPQKFRWLFIIAGAIYVGSALGMEMIEGFYRSAYWKKDVPYLIMVIVEELGEMIGLVVFVYALMSYISSHTEEMQVHIDEN